ncbi:MAG: hypothetical protein B1H04_03940 [Planctomycetales bacterium 4484_123]|nr:MAG: hypothetical protein B1H04_03940 [Planctomycetales bacterium 4484_123]
MVRRGGRGRGRTGWEPARLWKERGVFAREIRASVCALFFISAGGLLLHLRIHPPTEGFVNLLPAAFGVLGTLALPVMFSFRRTVAWAYMLNLAAVVAGTVTMGWHAARHLTGPVTWQALLLESTLPDILVLWAKLPLAHQVLRHFRPASGPDPRAAEREMQS